MVLDKSLGGLGPVALPPFLPPPTLASEQRQDLRLLHVMPPQDMTYTQMNLLTLRQQTGAPKSSSSEEPPDEPSVYTAIAIY
ncbi:hypothetical protein D623_10001026 [Myotis brandtii]|uniref:Uncharacterized protein n=1 Tax=Myotis brandtii TaxID=109478 RepID=S7MQR5_MYOBR|nr:hypothetical protein D623_10001026 [Myotis brandtii]